MVTNRAALAETQAVSSQAADTSARRFIEGLELALATGQHGVDASVSRDDGSITATQVLNSAPTQSPPDSSMLSGHERPSVYVAKPEKTQGVITSTNTTLTCAALIAALIFGIGAWAGQTYGKEYARKCYEVSLWELCTDRVVCCP